MSSKSGDKSRFEDLFSAARDKKAITNDEVPNKPTRLSKSKDPNYVRTTLYLPKKLHQQLKTAAIRDERDMSGIVEELIACWLNANDLDV